VAGRIAGGIFRPGDEVIVLPTGIRSRIASIDTYDGPLAEAGPPQSVAIRLSDDLDVGRGAMIVGADDVPPRRQELEAMVCWLGNTPVHRGSRYALQHTTRTVRAMVVGIQERLDIDTLERDTSAGALGPNDVGRLRLRLSEPVFADAYRDNRSTGAAILIDESTNETVGALMIQDDGSAWPG
jgi:bifunctional enzyme CysN/CysC